MSVLYKEEDISTISEINPNTPASTLESLSNNMNKNLKIMVIKHKNTDIKTIIKLSKHYDKNIRDIAKEVLNKKFKTLKEEEVTLAKEYLEEDMPRKYYICKNCEDIKDELEENTYLLQMDSDNSIINSYKYENSELISLKDGVINKIDKEFIKNYFYEHKNILNLENNPLSITRGQFFYLQELLTREEKEIKLDYQLTDPENIIFYGPPGTGKTYGFRKKALDIIYGKDEMKDDDIYDKYKELVKNNHISFTTFHPDYSYEAFIEGIKPKTNDDGNVIYEIESGAFLKTCEKALLAGLDDISRASMSENNQNVFDFFLKQNKDTQDKIYKKAGNFVFIIDEINRGNLPRIFGELITLMEPDKRLGAEEQITLKLPYSQKTFSIPGNVHILGSMNTADKSIAAIDTALRRRFRFVEVMPNTKLLEKVIIKDINIASLLEKINKNIEIYHDREHTIGHAYFMKLIKNPSFDLLCDIMEFQVIPLLQEYFYEDWGKVKLVLNNSELIKELIDKDTKNNKENNDIWKEKEKKIYKVNDSLKNRNESELIKLFKDICK